MAQSAGDLTARSRALLLRMPPVAAADTAASVGRRWSLPLRAAAHGMHWAALGLRDGPPSATTASFVETLIDTEVAAHALADRLEALAAHAAAHEDAAVRARMAEALDRLRTFAEARTLWHRPPPWGVAPRNDAMHGAEPGGTHRARERSRTPSADVPDTAGW